MISRGFLTLRWYSATSSVPQPQLDGVSRIFKANSAEEAEKLWNEVELQNLPLKERIKVAVYFISKNSQEFGQKILDETAKAYNSNSLPEIAEKLEKMAKKSTQKPSKGFFPYTEAQLLSSIRRILESGNENAFDSAVSFAVSAVKLRLAKVDGVWLKELVFYKLKNDEISSAIDVYSKFSSLTPHRKVFIAPVFAILQKIHEFSNKAQRKSKEFEEVSKLKAKMLKIIEENGSNLQKTCLEASVYLASGESLEAFDLLKRNEVEFGIDTLAYFTLISKETHCPEVLTPIADFGRRILPDHIPVQVEFYNTLIGHYGKRGDFDRLNELGQRLSKEIPRFELRQFRHVFYRIRHYYRCANKHVPEDLTAFLKRLGDY
ncbi:unnamed protein product [Bursaphelenchus xylophilus]|uniref:(pine wood nematode) hypothetical protein n=1 Tax=Bursaphelenchus xylophilus TaxID=6326 RepID=A0A1I7RWX2_BURXY|nr:unnamed protein product [Bursaphelenchus xylophilus]CAG9121175.1 unnamed protein product [Bursaphelenchus xylophilus]